ncbi:hypothetical protein [Vallicoccus soli]|uniref:DUF4232 domain-containing protein n=1 Tax=Vallicoccus soli TaxID=2339232 RepID=A0A3A3Z142_9ACTN|nr:hypothetical protein [Vallicoccus soli]RJK96965.1 hypothetical protein D5H78_06900 [Vallicoccus soli]
MLRGTLAALCASALLLAGCSAGDGSGAGGTGAGAATAAASARTPTPAESTPSCRGLRTLAAALRAGCSFLAAVGDDPRGCRHDVIGYVRVRGPGCPGAWDAVRDPAVGTGAAAWDEGYADAAGVLTIVSAPEPAGGTAQRLDVTVVNLSGRAVATAPGGLRVDADGRPLAVRVVGPLPGEVGHRDMALATYEVAAPGGGPLRASLGIGGYDLVWQGARG